MRKDIKLLHKMKSQNSFEEVIKMYTPYVSVIIYNTIGVSASKEDMEEVISDVFLNLWRNMENINCEKGDIRSYLGAVARNTAKNKLRSVHINDELNENLVEDTDNPEETLMKKESNRRLMNLITALGEPDSEIFLRYYYYNEKIRTISEIMNINISTVKTKLCRGKEKLKLAIIENRRDDYE